MVLISEAFNCRQATLDDAVVISYIIRSLSHFYLDESADKLPDWFMKGSSVSEFEQRIDSDEFFVGVCTLKEPGSEAEVIAGFLTLKLEDNRAHVQSLFVAEDYQKQGIARQLWRYGRQCCAVSEYSVRSSIYAVPVYTRLGFVADGDVQAKSGIRYQPMQLIVAAA